MSLKRLVPVTTILLAASHGLATFLGWYGTIDWLDGLNHFLGGIWLAALIAYYLHRFLESEKKIVKFIFIVCLALSLGVLWEIYEFIVDYFINQVHGIMPGSQTYTDTIQDLFLDLLGAATLGIFWLSARKQQPK